MGQIFFDLDIYNISKSRFIDAIRYNKTAKDSIALMFNLRNLAQCNMLMNCQDSVVTYYKQSLEISGKICPKTRADVETHAMIVEYYLNIGEDSLALSEFEKIKYCRTLDFNSDFIKTVVTNVYIAEKNYAKAEEMAKKILQEESVYRNEFAYSVLRKISRFKNDNVNYNNYTVKYGIVIDSLRKLSSKEAVIHQNSIYNYSLIEKDNIKLENERLRILIMSIIIILLLAIISVIIFYAYRVVRNKNKSLYRENNELLLANTKLLSQQSRLNIELTHQLEKVTSLENSIQIIKENQTSQQIEAKIKSQISNRIKNIDTSNQNADFIILNSKIYSEFRTKLNAKSGINILEKWLELDKIVNEAYPEFKSKLFYLRHDLSMIDYHVCLLIKCKFTPKEISILTFKEKNSISNIRKRLYFKLFGIVGTASELDEFIRSL